jgi:drug/metabolite transporter (DMT)-like permease
MSLPIKILLVLAMTVIGSFGALCFKFLAAEISRRPGRKKLLLHKYLWLGGLLYVLAAVFNVLLLRVMEYSIVYPLTALTYVWTMFISRVALNEKMNVYKLLALIFIFIGVITINI